MRRAIAIWIVKGGPMAATLGQLIRERRMELNLTQEELAERVGDGVRQS